MSKVEAVEGLKPWEHLKPLSDGESVTLEDGTVVHPSDVCQPPVPP